MALRLLCDALFGYRFETFGKEGVINVNGPAEVTATPGGERITAVFTEAELKWGDIRCVNTFTDNPLVL